jgi:hypothetical protein
MLRHRHCSRLLIASVAGRMALGMMPVALILTAQADGHSLATADLLAALHGLCPACGLPLRGRLADLRGLPVPRYAGAALVTTALGTLAFAGTSHLPVAVVLAESGCPPLEGGLRSLWHCVPAAPRAARAGHSRPGQPRRMRAEWHTAVRKVRTGRAAATVYR